jgi:hypothetical protein
MNNEFSLSAAREARIDRAIDRAVREMMQVDPPAGLRRRVLARLSDPAPRRGSLVPRFAFAAMALFVLAMSITLLRDRVEPPPPPKAPVMAMPAPAPPVDLIVNPAEPISLPHPNARFTREPIPMPPDLANVFGNRAGNVSAATIDAGTREIVMPPLMIVPLSARPIVIAPLVMPSPSKGGQ